MGQETSKENPGNEMESNTGQPLNNLSNNEAAETAPETIPEIVPPQTTNYKLIFIPVQTSLQFPQEYCQEGIPCLPRNELLPLILFPRLTQKVRCSH